MSERPRSGPYSGLTYRSAKRVLARRFEAAGLSFADEDALDLVLGLTGLSRTDYALRGTEFVPQDRFAAVLEAADRRLRGEPVDRILERRDFYGRRFAIDNVLSPRGDTEVLLLAALAAVRDVNAPRVLDLGTGSGVLALSLLAERPDASAVATDVDPDALATAARNANALGVADRVDLARSDWFGALGPGAFDAVLSNPPYIATDAMDALEREVSAHDPHHALHGGTDGLDPYRILVPGARDYLRPRGWLGVEIGFDQRTAVEALFHASGYRDVRTRSDPAGLDRVVQGRKP
ncbi:peptide chain release factor N(5)-glutamine methyltransferase [uncultured Algimonas sp.]|uniref:peptide chain release factor N(5)-glutamine methyltransferase n=1 Tax=uncultured Algimonas sp. TaxID=1547920 RepID=UPI0026160787|nr:peptide chain release factor N(5)-glutamine methyltransferase [uncultured Algimonas sp.]